MKYREQLPPGGPPEDAECIIDQRCVYRLVQQDPPNSSDFKSQRATNPIAKFSGVSECQAMGLSVLSSKSVSENIKKLPKFRKYKICRVELNSGAGKIQQTGPNRLHHTWWPLANYDILANCFVEN